MPALNEKVTRSRRPFSFRVRGGHLGYACLLAALLGWGRGVTAQGGPAGSAAVPTTKAAATRGVKPRPQLLATIRGTAVNLGKKPVAKTRVRLRDARTGRIVATEVTDENGAFSFHSVEPGSYIAEVIGEDQVVVTSSPIINANAGQLSTVGLRLPASPSQLKELLGSTAPSNPALAQAAASGNVATAVAVAPISER